MKRIVECDFIEARKYFLKEKCYFNFDLPQYFEFQKLIDKISEKLSENNLSKFYSDTSYIDGLGVSKTKLNKPCNYENVNYKFLNNKDGKFAWRPFQLIHPALYVSLVHKITEKESWELIINRFKEFEVNSKIKCTSIPLISETELSDKAATVSNWWQAIEQQSIELALDYEYVLHTDVTDCYGSIYTHSVVWALHTKEIGKKERGFHLIGNIIDKHLQDMAFGQTNGIPQGSVLMDFIAEMVLGYADLELNERIKNLTLGDYQIIRYRDDYRVFSNNPQDAELIMKHLTEILIDLGMRFNTQKTLVSSNVVKDSIKPDKLYWITNNKRTKSLQAHLLIIHELSLKFPNSGSLSKALNKFYKRIHKISETNQNILVLISIIVDIAFKSPRTYPIASAILSKFLSLIDNSRIQEQILESIFAKFDKIPNTGHIQLWLQRVTIKIERLKLYNETLCKKVNESTISLWNSDWLNDDFKTLISEEPIINEETIDKIDKIIELEEVELFGTKTSYEY
ncbi:MAG: RNA-directed DNA polymerase [Bacteroidia bacterium]|nr:RNA-directed DNA polymerase [Bacteroidia bacterium]